MAAKRILFLLILLTSALLVACDNGGGSEDNSDTSTDNSAAAKTVLDYLTAKVSSEEDAIRALLCADMEADLPRESASFASVQASLEDAACEVGQALSEADGDFTLVSCTGSIEALYGTENRSFELGTYRTTQEDGEWKYCGEG